MRFCILSDIHGNLEALRTTLEDARKENIDEYLCVGDVVGYGADPDECVKLVAQVCSGCVAGNHDWAVLGKFDLHRFNPFARDSVLWTREHLSAQSRTVMEGWPLLYRNDPLMMVHSDLQAPEEFGYLLDVGDAELTFGWMDRPVCFIGHTHVPMIFEEAKQEIVRLDEEHLDMQPGARYIINVGSVGQPRDGDSRAAYVILDTDAGTIHFKRVEYDIPTAQEKIIRAGLPSILADRLSAGY